MPYRSLKSRQDSRILGGEDVTYVLLVISAFFFCFSACQLRTETHSLPGFHQEQKTALSKGIRKCVSCAGPLVIAGRGHVAGNPDFCHLPGSWLLPFLFFLPNFPWNSSSCFMCRDAWQPSTFISVIFCMAEPKKVPKGLSIDRNMSH